MIRLSRDDKKVIEFLSEYKIMQVEDTKLIYHSEWYHRKKIKKLVEEGYIKKYKFYYIELDKKGREYLNITGTNYIKNKSNGSYMERLKQISKIGTITINSKLRFIPSWKVKEKGIFTDTARKYLGILITKNDKYLIYAVSDKKEKTYIHQLIYDIKKVLEYNKVIIFVDSLDKLKHEYKTLNFQNENTYIIVNTKENRELIKIFDSIDFYELVRKIYGSDIQILFSDWDIADYCIENDTYIINMLFLDIVKINRLRWFYQENENTKKIIKILTLKENEDIIKNLVPQSIHIVSIEKEYFLKGAGIENMENK